VNLTRRAFLSSTGAAFAAAPSQRPNILLILADDMGFSDIGCYGSEIDTPNLDRLAGQGVRFTQHYNCARCCPSRATLLTGLYPHQAGIGHMVDQAGPAPGYVDDLSPRTRTIAEVLRTTGYQTGMVGKWHVTPVNQSRHNWPMQRGFDRYYGIIHGAADYYNPVTLTRGNDPVKPEGEHYHFTDALGANGVRFLDEFKHGGEPFFLYAAFTAPHWPLHARPADILKYKDRYRAGWDALREARHQRQVRMGMLPRRWDVSVRDIAAPSWKDAPDPGWQAYRMAVYAAQVEQLDRNIGRLLTRLRENGQEDNTLVMFMSDNGGCAEEVGPRWKGLHIPATTPDGKPVRVGNNSAVMPGPEAPTRATDCRGPTPAILHSVFTSTGCTKAGSRRR
jgi:arylsulfatase